MAGSRCSNSRWWLLTAQRRAGARFPGRALLILPYMTALFTLGQAFGHDPGRGPPSDTGPPSALVWATDGDKAVLAPVPPNDPEPVPINTADPPRRITHQSGSDKEPGVKAAPAGKPPTETPELPGDNWHHNLVRERPVEVRLRTAQKELQAGHVTEALFHLQAVLDSGDDVFVRLESQPVPAGAQFLADRLLGSLDPPARAAYETLHGSEARNLLNSARAQGDARLLTQIVRRFFHTSAGGDATILLAYHWLDHGGDELAATCWQRVLAEPAHRQRLQPSQRAAAAWCLHRAGQNAAARILVEELGRQPLAIAGRTIQPQALIDDTIFSPQFVTGTRVAVVGDSADRNAVHTGTAPALDHPLWKVSLAGNASAHLVDLVTAWEPYQKQNGLPIGAAHFPLVVGDRLVFRDYEGIRAVSLAGGESLWSYTTRSSMSRDIPAPPKPTAPVEGNPDPNNLMKSMVGNCLLGMLAADGRRIFAVDQVETDQPTQTVSATSASEAPHVSRRQSNSLIALAIVPDSSPDGTIQPLWSVGGREATIASAGDDPPPQVLAGHFFIGPPLPLADRLYAVSEHHQQLHLSCLDAADGTLTWTQPICSVPQPISTDFHRYFLVCSPSYGEGVLVVPTQAGVLVAVDPVTGRLLWAAPHDDAEPQHRQQMSAWPYSSRRRYSHPGYPNLPLIHQGQVVFLPAHSEFVHCLDLASGTPRWRVRREDLEPSSACEYVAAVTDQTVLLVGRRCCRGVDFATGTIRYRTRLASAPAGRGVQMQTSYQLPLDDGRIVSLDPAGGKVIAATRADAGAGLGNLVAGGNLLISMGRSHIAAWPQAGHELARLDASLATAPTSLEHILAAAELELTLGHAAQAQARLDAISKDAVTDPVRELMRRVVLAQLQDSTIDRGTQVVRLAQLARTPEHRARYLLERARFEHDRALTSLPLTVRELSGQHRSEPLGLLDDPSRFVAAGPFVAALERHAVGSNHAWSDAATASGHLIAHGKDHQAELLLLETQRSDSLSSAAAATRLLAELWQKQGLEHDAARMLDELRNRFSAIDVEPGVTGREYLDRQPQSGAAWAAYRRLAPPDWSGAGVRITENKSPHDDLQAIYNGNNVQHLAVPRGLPFDLFDRGRGVAGQLTLVDRHSGLERPESIEFPGRYSYPVISSGPGHLQHSYVGHFVPLGGTGAVHGLSLLERRLVWSTTLDFLQFAKDLVRVGPAGSRFCAFQYRQHLFVLDPADGRLLWRRDDLEPLSGLMSDPVLGMIGDDRVLAVFSGQGTNYTLYDTATGEELRRGRIDVQPRLVRRAYGRKLWHFTSGEGRRIRVWDALTDRFVWDEAADEFVEASQLDGVAPGTKVFCFVRDTDEAAFVTRSGRLRVADLARGEWKFDVPLEPRQLENLSYLRAFRDRDRYYVNFQRSQSAAAAASYIISDATIPVVHVQGDLCAVDRHTYEVLWTRSLGNRSVLQLADYHLPVLVTIYRVRTSDQPTLAIEVLDAATGATLAVRDDLLSDRLLQVLYERQPGVIALRGGKTEIRLDFPGDVARLNVLGLPQLLSAPR